MRLVFLGNDLWSVPSLEALAAHPGLDVAAVITNPPRVGMAPKAVDVLAMVRPRRLIYVSCDPATLARDVARLGSGWRVVSVKGFDLFPQTAHVETVLVLEAA